MPSLCNTGELFDSNLRTCRLASAVNCGSRPVHNIITPQNSNDGGVSKFVGFLMSFILCLNRSNIKINIFEEFIFVFYLYHFIRSATAFQRAHEFLTHKTAVPTSSAVTIRELTGIAQLTSRLIWLPANANHQTQWIVEREAPTTMRSKTQWVNILGFPTVRANNLIAPDLPRSTRQSSIGKSVELPSVHWVPS